MRFSENILERAIIELFETEGIPHRSGETIHKTLGEVLLRDDLKQYLLNKYADEEITLHEINTITRQLENLPSETLYDTNKKILSMFADGFSFTREDRNKKDIFIHLLDYNALTPQQNENENALQLAAEPKINYPTRDKNIFRFVTQLEIQGTEKRIPDGIVYINGLPVVVLEFKTLSNETVTIADAHTQLTVRYRRDIPELFKYNAFCVISDGVNTKMGSLFSDIEYFYAWRKINANDTSVDGIDALHTMIRGLFNKKRLLDVIRNFIYFPDTSTHDVKIVCRYPQYYAANKLFENVQHHRRPNGDGKGGTYFGATGCGKSFTMLYLTRLLMKSKALSSPTIILITDRTDLDDQLSTQFTNAKNFLGDENVISVESRAELKTLLQNRNSGGVFLTTIHKFTESTELLTTRSNVICISDEAHRSQINLQQKIKISGIGATKKFGFAKYLHDSLPAATYVGFTGTPVDGTIDVFGKIIDAYTMQESVSDGITVKIMYEGRAAKVNLNESKLHEIEKYYAQCADEGTNTYQIEASKKAVTQMEVILGDPKRLKLVAEDFVEHYEKRIEEGASVKGKVMFVASSRLIAYELYKQIIALKPEWAEIKENENGETLTEKEKRELKPIERVKLVMTRNPDDEADLFKMLGTKENRKELDRQFKNVKSNFKIAIVVDMWLTGFDVPFLDAIYIDKPVQQHTLIQTISRVNRVYEGKEFGLVVDYIGIKSSMNLALKKYSNFDGDEFEGTDKAVIIVKDQLDLLSKFFHTFSTKDYFFGTPLQKLNCLNRAAEFVQQTKENETRFVALVKKLRSAYDLCCSSNALSATEEDFIHFYFTVKTIIHKLTIGDAPDTGQMNTKVRKMIEEALISEGIEEVFKLDKNDGNTNEDIFSDAYLEKIEKLQLPNTKIKLLQKLLAKAIEAFKKTNRIKGIDFSQKLKKLVEIYNERKDFPSFANDVLDDVTDQFVNLFRELQQERQSFLDLGINYEEKAFYDILKAVAEKHKFEYAEDKLIKLSQEVKKIVDDKARYTDWAQKEDIKSELKVDLILLLEKYDYPPEPRDEIFKEVFEQAENFKKYLE